MGQNGRFVAVEEIDQRIAEIEEQLVKLPIQLELLRRLRAEAVDIGTVAVVNGDEPTSSARFGPTQAILRHLAKAGRPLRMAQIIDSVEDSVESSASNIRRSLYSTVNNLKTRGLVTVEDGVVELTEDGLSEVK